MHGSPYYKPVKLNGILLRHREEIEKELNINITMVGIDECLYENQVKIKHIKTVKLIFDD